MLVKILTFVLLFSATFAFAQQGSIRGTVFDGATGEFLPGVTVFVEGTTTGTITDLDGNFNVRIDPGKYSIRISFISYEPMIVTDVPIKSNEVFDMGEIKMEEATVSLNEVTITANVIRNTETALISMKKRSPNLIDGISSGELNMIGDSDAAGAMKRVPGVSVSQGKYVYVRGLGDRYTKSLLNGVDIPGLDPDRNSLQIDIFPTSVIDNIVVHKTFSADLPADFTGGAVDIEIKDFPSKEKSQISFSLGYNRRSHFNNEYLTYDGGKMDFLGFDDGTRAIPATENIPQYAQVVGNPQGDMGARYSEILHAFNPSMSAIRQRSFADIGLGFSYGNQKQLSGFTIGYNAAVSYKNTTEFYENAEYGKYGLSDPGTFEMDRREYQTGSYGSNQVLLSGLAGFAIKSSKSKFRLNLLHLQHGESKAGIFDFVGSDQGSDFNAFQHSLDYSQRSLSNLLVDGKHALDGEWTVIWKLSPTLSKLEDPDIRFARYEINDDQTYRIGTEVGFPERIWRELFEFSGGGILDITKKFNLNGRASSFQFGGSFTYKNRKYTIRNFAINPRGGYPLTGDPNELFLEENLWVRDGDVGSGTTYETPFIPSNPNQFDASSYNSAAYASSGLALTDRLKTTVGLRFENYQQFYTGSDQTRSNVLNNEMVMNSTGLFPSINLIYQLRPEQNFRLSYTKTVARPSFKELSYAEIYDPISGVTFIGGFHQDTDDRSGIQYWDGKLKVTNIRNFDIRWEWFGKDGQMVSLGSFYKTFENPIEIIQYTKQVGAFQPRNVGEGQSMGVEFELRQNLAFLSESFSGFRIVSNITLNRSSINMSTTEFQSRIDNARSGQAIDRIRVMAGQAPYLINGGISFSNGKHSIWEWIDAGIYYNVQGPTLEYVGVADRPDIFSNPFHSLNFNSSAQLGKDKRLIMNLKIQNLLNEKFQLVYQSYKAVEQTFERRDPGTTITLKFTYLLKD